MSRWKFASRVCVTLFCFIFTSLANTHRVALSQTSCPFDPVAPGCYLMPPTVDEAVSSTFNDHWSTTFNSSSSDCVFLYQHFQGMYMGGRAFAGVMTTGLTGAYTGDHNGNGSVVLGSQAFYGSGELMKTVIHESSHDYGCGDSDYVTSGTADAWESYCVSDYEGQLRPPPPQRCPNWP